MRKIFSLAACLLLGIGIAACSSSGPAYFLSSAPGLVVLIQWQPPQNGQAVGIVTQVQPSGTAPNQILGVTTVPVDVAINGRAVTLTPTGLGELFGGTRFDGRWRSRSRGMRMAGAYVAR
jgi:hypothetical protein